MAARRKQAKTPLCQGKKKNGKPCTQFALKGTERCWRHPVDTVDGSRTRKEDWSRETFLMELAETGMVSRAAEAAGVSRSTVYNERERNDGFAERWADIDEVVIESLEEEALRRARDGVEEPLVSAGKLVTTVRRFDSSLLMFLLKAKRPHIYRERVDIAHSGEVKGGKVVFVAPDADEKRAGVAAILAEAGAVNGNGNGNTG
jgi:hypothetical protein